MNLVERYKGKFNFLVQIFGYYKLIQIIVRCFMNYKFFIKKIPFVQSRINNKRLEIISNIKDNFEKQVSHIPKFIELPNNGLSSENLIKLFDIMSSKIEVDFKGGKVSGATYSNNADLDNLMNGLFPYFNKSNPLHTNIFPSVRKMEQECVKIMINLFNGTEDTCGVFTSGGTESILMACKAYREYSRSSNPEILASTTVHCAFNKACKYFNIKLRLVDCDKDGKIDLNELEKNINKNTILIVGSTPSYNLGIIDQIHELNDLCLRKQIPLHLDACIGSFLINFLDNSIGFNLRGVTSVSADFHKYGNSPKGASCIMYSHKDIMRHQYFIDEKWSGGIYATSSFTGSRCGNKVALTWATLLYYGLSGYKNNYDKIINLKNYFVRRLMNIEEIFVIGEPQLSIVAIGSDIVNINVLAEELKHKEWEINVIQNPNGFHFCLTSYHNTEIIDNFISDLKDVILENRDKKIKYSPCIYGTMEKINDTEIIKDVISDYLNCINGI